MIDYLAISTALERVGLLARGGFDLEPGELTQVGLGSSFRSLIMVGNAGTGLWAALKLVLTYDQAPEPLNRWTQQVLAPIAKQFSAEVVFPFGGPPYLPFQRWAQRAEPVYASPIGPLVHPEFGLWHAYRGALLFEDQVVFPQSVTRGATGGGATGGGASPCEACDDQPCLSTCPVGAFSPGHYDVAACAEHVASPAGIDCLTNGCQARGACPVGRGYRYDPMQARFHMEAFIIAQGKELA